MKGQATQDTSIRPYRVDTVAEDNYWREAYADEPYFNRRYNYNDYSPAYKLGYEGRDRYMSCTYKEAETELSRAWDKFKGRSRLVWSDARQAVRAGWYRVELAMPGDAES